MNSNKHLRLACVVLENSECCRGGCRQRHSWCNSFGMGQVHSAWDISHPQRCNSQDFFSQWWTSSLRAGSHAAGNVIVLQPTKTAMTFCDINPGRWIDVPARFQLLTFKSCSSLCSVSCNTVEPENLNYRIEMPSDTYFFCTLQPFDVILSIIQFSSCNSPCCIFSNFVHLRALFSVNAFLRNGKFPCSQLRIVFFDLFTCHCFNGSFIGIFHAYNDLSEIYLILIREFLITSLSFFSLSWLGKLLMFKHCVQSKD